MSERSTSAHEQSRRVHEYVMHTCEDFVSMCEWMLSCLWSVLHKASNKIFCHVMSWRRTMQAIDTELSTFIRISLWSTCILPPDIHQTLSVRGTCRILFKSAKYSIVQWNVSYPNSLGPTPQWRMRVVLSHMKFLEATPLCVKPHPFAIIFERNNLPYQVKYSVLV